MAAEIFNSSRTQTQIPNDAQRGERRHDVVNGCYVFSTGVELFPRAACKETHVRIPSRQSPEHREHRQNPTRVRLPPQSRWRPQQDTRGALAESPAGRARPGEPEAGTAVRYLRQHQAAGAVSSTEEPLFPIPCSTARGDAAPRPQPQQRGAEQAAGRAGRGRIPRRRGIPRSPPAPGGRQGRAGSTRGRATGEAGGRSAVLGAAAGSERRFANGATPTSVVSAFYYYI